MGGKSESESRTLDLVLLGHPSCRVRVGDAEKIADSFGD